MKTLSAHPLQAQRLPLPNTNRDVDVGRAGENKVNIEDVTFYPSSAVWLTPGAERDTRLYREAITQDWQKRCERCDLREYFYEDEGGNLNLVIVNGFSEHYPMTLQIGRGSWALREEKLTGL